ncbi:RDD family protein [Streptomyces sp. 8N114]|uniref:RDD family protein n=1 Tax=Streptomyces sp. 8N114 TaxID=3457419 RepID=UPI003FD15C69
MTDDQRPQAANQPYAPPYAPPSAHPPPHPYPQPYPQPPLVPNEVGDERRGLAALIDATIAFVAGLGLASRLAGDESVGTFWRYAVVCALAVSFVHQVLGAVVFRATVGKFLLLTRVVREADAGRPRFWQAVRRWLLGLTWLPMQPLRSLIGAEGDPYEDACGLRYVRKRDLRR